MLLGASNFDALFEDADEATVRDVLMAYAEEDLAAQAKAGEVLRPAAGYLNQLDHHWTAFGTPTVRVTTDDFWRQQVVHNAMGDPGLWDWFAKRPEGEYARVRSRSARIVVGFNGSKRETIRF